MIENRSDIVLNMIKEFYFKSKHPVPIQLINKALRNKFSTNKMRFYYRELARDGKIKINDWKVEPNVSNEDLEMMEKVNKKVPVTLEKIRICIKKFFQQKTTYPKPSDIERMFISEFGMPCIKDFTRLLRRYAEEGKIMRTDDYRYYYKMNLNQVGVNEFV